METFNSRGTRSVWSVVLRHFHFLDSKRIFPLSISHLELLFLMFSFSLSKFVFPRLLFCLLVYLFHIRAKIKTNVTCLHIFKCIYLSQWDLSFGYYPSPHLPHAQIQHISTDLSIIQNNIKTCERAYVEVKMVVE